VSRDEDEQTSPGQQLQPAPALVSRHRESGYITPSDQELIIDSIFAPCHDRLATASVKSAARVDQQQLDGLDGASSTLDATVASPSLAAYLACVVPPPPTSISDRPDSDIVPCVVVPPPPVESSMDVDPAALVVPPPPPPTTASSPASATKLPPQPSPSVADPRFSASTVDHTLSTQSVANPVYFPLPVPSKLPPPPTMPKHARKSAATENQLSDVTAGTPRQRLLNGDVTDYLINGNNAAVTVAADLFPPPPPLDDVCLPSASVRDPDNLPPPPPSVLRGGAAGSTLQRAASSGDAVPPAPGCTALVDALRRTSDTSDHRRLQETSVSGGILSPSSSSSSDSVSSELAAAMLAARLRAEPNQPLSTGMLIFMSLLIQSISTALTL